MKILRDKRWKTYGLCLVLFLLCTACGRSSAHCYLHEGIPSEAVYVVDLSTGSMSELTVGDNNGAMTWTSAGSARVVIEPYKARATIPAEAQEVNAGLFCDDCMTLIAATPSASYVLADLHDLGHIQLYPIEAGNSFTIRDYNIQIEAGADGTRIVTVTNEKWVSS